VEVVDEVTEVVDEVADEVEVVELVVLQEDTQSELQ